MSIWGKIIGGAAGYALGGPLGALLGVVAGHAVDRIRGEGDATPESSATRQVAFTIAMIVLSAKMAKADGVVTRDEVNAFKNVFRIPPGEAKGVGRVFDEARRDASGFEPYAQQVAKMFAHEPAVLEELLGGLFHIAVADGVVHPAEMAYLRQVGEIFGLDAHGFERVRVSHMGAEAAVDPYEVLGVAPGASDAEVKAAYRALIRENHPDKLIAQGLPQEFVDLANEKMASINAAYDRIERQRGLK
ncbi:MAG: TerB family tellurite resistance protein [Hyphomicrobiales bacterium]|nr:TerB family tellurite resistance protein [Hyphomicrobiales bacterium]MCP5371199.1 TerB family tellurite resistance protein [Hyphomicrobiales bacterium]